jgi:cellulose synthase/poly-beta-1,6-N-acetylglucosamine synthase-like glycosyltransferase
MFIQFVFLGLSLILTMLFFLYGFNQYYLLNRAARYKPPVLGAGAAQKPRVDIHLPIYNERYVVCRLVAACARMAESYGKDRVKIVIVDDSDDDTKEVVDGVTEEYLNKDYKVEVLRRGSRLGFKAGALQEALLQSDAEFIAIFDADFIPPAEFLLHTIPYFIQDPSLGIIQSRWGHINKNYNLLTRAIALGIDVHFLVDQAGRYAAGCFQNFNGSGGILRRVALLEAGGWQADTLAEDLDVSYRIQLMGYQILYLKDIQSPGEIPPTVPSYKKQQARWANGSLRTARKILPGILADRKLDRKKRLQSFIHLTGYMVHPLMLSSFLLACLASLFQVNSFNVVSLDQLSSITTGAGIGRMGGLAVIRYFAWGTVALLIALCTVSAWITPLVVMRVQGLPVSKNLSSLLVLYMLGCGVSLSNTIEAGKALFTNKSWAFKRTPKYAIQQGKGEWKDKRYQVPLDAVCLLEFALVCLGITAIGDAIFHSNLGVLLILIPYTAAYGFVFLLTIVESRSGESR